MAYEIFKHLQQVGFDDLSPHLLDAPGLFEKVRTGIGNVFDRLSDAVGRDNVCLELQFNKLNAQHLVNRALIDFAKNNSLNDRLIVKCPAFGKSRNYRFRSTVGPGRPASGYL